MATEERKEKRRRKAPGRPADALGKRAERRTREGRAEAPGAEHTTHGKRLRFRATFRPAASARWGHDGVQ